jgi:hypothetical protein
VTPPLRLLPNVGAEEGAAAEARPHPPQVATVAQLWRPLFAAGADWLDPALAETPYPAALGPRPDAAVFPWLAVPDGITAWLNTEAAARAAAAAGGELNGPAPGVVRRVHDKAFAHEVACREGWLPQELVETIAVLEPAELADADHGIRRLQTLLAGWPEEARRRFTLKPRFGCSGRGRVAGSDGAADTEELRGALPRLAQRGGALLEPWCDRSEDLSASLWLGDDGELLLLGTTRQWLAPSGLYLGQRGTLDTKGRVTSGSERDETLREAAAAVARAAARCGFRGPCGVDAFAYRTAAGEERFRPVVELNARFTMGILAIGWARRSLAKAREAFHPHAGQRLHFHFGLDAPRAGWPESDASLLVLPLASDGAAVRPALVMAADPETLARRLGERAG